MSVKLKKLKSGKYALSIIHKGQRQQKTIGTLAAAKQARVLLEIEIAKDNLGILEKSAVPTFGKVASSWIDYIKVSKSIGTYNRYSGIIKKHLRPLANKQIDKITRGDVRDVLLKLYKKGSSKSSIGLIHTVASGVFSYALDDELISVVPTRGLLRRMELLKDKKEITPFTTDQIELLLFTVDDPYQNFFETSFHTGARVGELCALQWRDINFSDQVIRISKTAKDQHIQKSTKTHVVREIDMSDRLFSMLINLKKEDRKLCLKLGIAQNHVFHDRGMLLSQNTLRRKLSQACKRLGIGHHTIHSIRHTTASVLLSRGVPLLYVSKVLGHSSPKITLDQYSHYMPSENKGLINTLGGTKNNACSDLVDEG